MIIFLIVLFTLLTYIGLVVLKSLLLRILIGGTSILMLVLSVGLLTLHLDKNWGTKIVTSRQRSTDIYTAGDLSSPFGMIIKAEIGQNTGNYVFIYRTSKTEKKGKPQFKPATDSISQIVTAIKKKKQPIKSLTLNHPKSRQSLNDVNSPTNGQNYCLA